MEKLQNPNPEHSSSTSISYGRGPTPPPERKLVLFALRLALMEKAASLLGALGFVWATVVLLGGFAIVMGTVDFWSVTVILLIEAARIFSRSHELEWQHQASFSPPPSPEPPPSAFLRRSAARYEETAGDGLGSWVSRGLYWLQVMSATTCVVMSTIRLVCHDYGEAEKGDSDRRNRKSALIIFYALALSEGLLFLLEKAYWEWQVTYERILEKVREECEVGESGRGCTRRFFYEAYSRCVKGSVLEGMKMELVSFSMDLLSSSSINEQLLGLRLLLHLSLSPSFSNPALHKVAVCRRSTRRVVEMVKWTPGGDEETVWSAALILSALLSKKHNPLRLGLLPGAMDALSSLLYATSAPPGSWFCEEWFRVYEGRHHHLLHLLGLSIFKKLSRSLENCRRIGSTRGLLLRIVHFTRLEDEEEQGDGFLLLSPSRLLTLRRSLQLLKNLVCTTTGDTGKRLRKEISDIVFTVSNIKGILKHGGRYPGLQRLGIEILTALSSDDCVMEVIGRTGGVLRLLFSLFLHSDKEDGHVSGSNSCVTEAAGHALTILVMGSECNCTRALRLGVVENTVLALKNPLLRANAARILRNLCCYSRGPECLTLLSPAAALAAPTAIEGMVKERGEVQEVMTGLAAGVVRFMGSGEWERAVEKAGATGEGVAGAVVEMVRWNKKSKVKNAKIRRYALEVGVWMMREDEVNVKLFKELGLVEELLILEDTICELDNFNLFSTSSMVGIGRHSLLMDSLLSYAMHLLLLPPSS